MEKGSHVIVSAREARGTTPAHGGDGPSPARGGGPHELVHAKGQQGTGARVRASPLSSALDPAGAAEQSGSGWGAAGGGF